MYWKNVLCVALALAAFHFETASSEAVKAPTNWNETAPHKTDRVSPIVIHGNKFFDSGTGEELFIKGIAYQPSRAAGDAHFADAHGAKFIDPMAEPKICLRDLPYLVDLGVNTVRIYSFDSEREHDVCFEAFGKAGIYVIADLSEPDLSIVRGAPSWDITIYERYTKVVDALHKYNNLLGFFAGNEVTNDKTNTDASPFVKAAIRDMKKYINSKGYRNIPVGYSSNDDAETRNSLADYFSCGEDFADFYGINMYEWCGYSTFYASGYRERTEEFRNYPIPVFFSEFGCNVKRPRPFTEVEAIYSRLMTDVWSGAIAYMFFEEPNQYGVVELVDGHIRVLDDFANLQEQFTGVNPKGTTLDEYKAKATVQKTRNCPNQNKFWEASSVIPLMPDSGKCECMVSSLECQLNSHVKESELRPLFDYACGVVDCEAIKGDGKIGEYGDFADCSAKQKASYVINELYLSSQEKKCDFKGMATLNQKAIKGQDLNALYTNSGKSCAQVMSVHNSKKQETSFSWNNVNGTVPELSNSTESGGRSGFSSRASQIGFYNNIFQAVVLSAVFFISLAMIL